jgi:hypothetical protein
MTREQRIAQTKAVHDKIASYIGRHPEITLTAMSADLGISLPRLSTIATKYGFRRNKKFPGFDAALMKKLEG